MKCLSAHINTQNFLYLQHPNQLYNLIPTIFYTNFHSSWLNLLAFHRKILSFSVVTLQHIIPSFYNRDFFLPYHLCQSMHISPVSQNAAPPFLPTTDIIILYSINPCQNIVLPYISAILFSLLIRDPISYFFCCCFSII